MISTKKKLPRAVCPYCNKIVIGKWVGDMFYIQLRKHTNSEGEQCSGSYGSISFDEEAVDS